MKSDIARPDPIIPSSFMAMIHVYTGLRTGTISPGISG